MTRRAGQKKLTARQTEALDAWAAYLYRRGYTARQAGLAMRLSPSAVGLHVAKAGVPARRGPGRLPDPEPDSIRWRELEMPPGHHAGPSPLNQGGLLTSALVTWQSRNALSVFANRAQSATGAELEDAVRLLEETVRYARQLQQVLTDPAFAAAVRADPGYRDDVGHRFRPAAGEAARGSPEGDGGSRAPGLA